MIRSMTVFAAVAALLLCGCQVLRDVSLPSPEDVGEFVAHNAGLATYDEAVEMRGQMREEVDSLRAHSDESDAAIRGDAMRAEEAARKAVQEAIAKGVPLPDAIVKGWEAKLDAAGMTAAEAKAAAEEARKGVKDTREEIDALPRGSVSEPPEGAITGIGGWGGVLFDTVLTLLAAFGIIKGGGKGFGAVVRRVAARTPNGSPQTPAT